ncbi:MAG TPA: hypothetical protein VK668_12645 [Mucilaginibacter sp.]|nr:hypothetical protein [Mucilaginibacter sp.]
MEQFSILDPNRSGELNIVKDGWINPSFTLTDGINTYGKLSYTRWWRRTGTVETARQSWVIEPQKLFSRKILIKEQSTAQTITITKTNPWLGLVNLELPDGQIFQFKRESIFSKTQSWYNEQFGNILSVESRLFSYKQPFKIILGQNIPADKINLVLMAFIGVHLILLRRAHAAAAH